MLILNPLHVVIFIAWVALIFGLTGYWVGRKLHEPTDKKS